MIVLIFMALLPEYVYNRIQREFFPYPYQIIQERERDQRAIPKVIKPVLIPQPRTHRVSIMNTTGRKELTQSQVHLGFAFSAGKEQTEWLDKRLRNHTKTVKKGIAEIGDESDSSDLEERYKARYRDSVDSASDEEVRRRGKKRRTGRTGRKGKEKVIEKVIEE